MKRAVLILCLAACGSSTKPTTDPLAKPAALAVQTAVEDRLLPAVVVRGEDAHFSLAERMAKYRVPGLSIAVFDNYQLVWAKAYGLADVETKQPVTEATLFQAGSISKSVNALTVMIEVEDGTLDLDTPVNTYLRSWKLPDNDLTRATPVTLRRILSHTAGLTVHGFPGYEADTPVPTIVQILDGQPPANTPAIRVDLAPGKEFRYSGGGTTVSQLVLIDTLGGLYQDIARARVLEPLGMTDSTYEQPLPPGRIAAAAAGTYADGTIVPGKRHVYPEMAAAGLWTTPTDLAKFFAELALARTGKASRIPQSIATQMTTIAMKTGPEDEGGVGLGVFIMDRNGAMMFGHGGADEGFQADAVASLDGGYGVVVMANSDNGFALFPEIERTVFAAMGWPGADAPVDRVALTPAQREMFVGSYVGGGGLPFVVTTAGDRLELARPMFATTELVPVAPDKVASTESPLIYKVSAPGLELSRGGSPVGVAERLPAGARLPLIELAAGRFDDAVAAWKELLEKDPKAPQVSEEAHNQYGYDLLVDGRLDAAISVFRAVVAVFPESSNAYDSLGEAYMKAGKTQDAIAAYQRAIAKLEADTKLRPETKPDRRKHAEAMLAKLRAR